jgi:beta-glucosidase
MELSELSADRDCARVTITNHSDISADEVIELYIRDNKSPAAPANPVLCCFARVHLDPGGEKHLTIPIQPRAFTVVTETGRRVPGSGDWTLYAGFGQPDARTEELTGQKCLSVPVQ